MNLRNKICVFDFETDGSNPLECSPVQIAAVIVDPVSLKIVPDSEFNITTKPILLENNPSHKYEDSDILDFHAKVYKCTGDEVLERWKAAVPQKLAWQNFQSYLDMYHSGHHGGKKSQFTAPIACGYNIFRFDLKIVERFSAMYGYLNKENTSNLFYQRDVIDLMNLAFYWFESNSDIKSLSLDSLRDYLGISKDGAHDALKDVKDCANLVIRFLRLHRSLGQKVKFKDSFHD